MSSPFAPMMGDLPGNGQAHHYDDVHNQMSGVSTDSIDPNVASVTRMMWVVIILALALIWLLGKTFK